MGKKINHKLIVTAVILCLVGIPVFYVDTASEPVKKSPIRNFFLSIPGYGPPAYIKLQQSAYDMLELDDYLFANYRGPAGDVNLYIGYYYSADKAYAAHDPLVCYPSQGWQINNAPTVHTLEVGSQKISYEEVVTSWENRKELVLYWYQTGLFTNNQVYRNKISMGYNKLRYDDEQHGFIRIAVPFINDSQSETKEAALAFIRSFYPQFLEYINSTRA